MAKSKITGKTFDEMLSESTELDLSAKFKDIIYEFSNDVHAMGMVVYTYEEGSSKFLFKDSSFKNPVTDYELLAMYLDEVVATRLADENTSLERCRDLEAEKVKYLEYKEGDFVKRFYKIGNYFSGETYFDLNGFVPGDSKYALVGSAIVGKSVVGKEEKPAMQTIWEGTFTGEETSRNGFTYFLYSPSDTQNMNLIKSLSEVSVTFDGTAYKLPVQNHSGSYGFGEENPEFNDYPFLVGCDMFVEGPVLHIMTQTAGPHTLKVEGTPSNNENVPGDGQIVDVPGGEIVVNPPVVGN